MTARLRSVSLMSAWIPIFFQCWATISICCAHGKNAAATVVISMRRRSLLSVRNRYPSESFLSSPILSSKLLAWAMSRVDHLVRHSGPGLSGASSAGATEPGVPVPRKNASLIWARSMPIDRARRKSLLFIHFAISGSALYDRLNCRLVCADSAWGSSRTA